MEHLELPEPPTEKAPFNVLPDSPSSAAERTRTPLWTLKVTQLLGSSAWACLVRFIAVFYAEIGLSRNRIGLLTSIGPLVAFAGQNVWAIVIDRFGGYKLVLAGTNAVGGALVFLNMLPAVQESFFLIMCVTVSWNFLLCTDGPIIDAMCIQVLRDQGVSTEGYGDQRLWCAVGWGGMSLIAGALIDSFGVLSMFVAFIFIQGLNITVCLVWLPGSVQRSGSTEVGQSYCEFLRQLLGSFQNAWFFTNLLVYGLIMTLVETFLLVFLLQDFVGSPKVLLGACVTVMCAFEVPVFKYADRLWTRHGWSLDGVILVCELVFVVRCFLYTLLPPEWPWLVLLIEPLHGITFAALWAATVEYGTRIAPAGGLVRVQALLNGVFYQLAQGIGAFLWGACVQVPPRGIGFRRSFVLDGCLGLAWCLVWQLGRRRFPAASLQTESTEELVRREEIAAPPS